MRWFVRLRFIVLLLFDCDLLVLSVVGVGLCVTWRWCDYVVKC